MMRGRKPVAALAALVVALGTGGARAEYLNWSYGWSLGPGQGPTIISGTTNVAFALSTGGNTGAATIAVGTLSTNSSTTGTDSVNAPYDLTLTLTDNATHDAGKLTFHGLISGSNGPTSTSLANAFSNPSQSLTLDGRAYQVSLDPTTTIGGGKDAPVPVSAQVSVADTTGKGTGGGVQSPSTPQVQQAPEPSAVLLASLGASLFVVARRRRR
jgi:hypothetical protein